MKRENAGFLVLAGLFAVFGYVTRCAPGHLDGNATPAPVETRTPERIAELERIAKTEAARSRVPEAAPSQDAPDTVRAADFGPDWPFVPQEGILACLPNAGRPVVLLTVDSGKRYALNGNARDSSTAMRFGT